jgi:hypothetical protein
MAGEVRWMHVAAAFVGLLVHSHGDEERQTIVVGQEAVFIR